MPTNIVISGEAIPLWLLGSMGALFILVMSQLPFRHLITVMIFTLSITEIDIPGEPFLSRGIRDGARIGRWFVFVVVALKWVGVLVKGAAPRKGAPIRVIAFLIVVLAFISGFYSIHRTLTLTAALVLALAFVCAFQVVWSLVNDEKGVVDVVHAVFRAVSPLIVISILMIPFVEFSLTEGRYSGLFFNANGLGLSAAVLLPIGLWEVSRTKGGLLKFLRVMIVLCLVMAVLVSKSRSAMVGSLASAAVFILFRYRRTAQLVPFIVLPFVAIFIIAGEDLDPRGNVDVLVRTGSLEDVGGRREKWESGLAYAAKRPFLGYGYGTSRRIGLVSGQDDSLVSLAAGVGGTDYHSSHLQTLLELGAVGLILLEIAVIMVVITGFRLFTRSHLDALPLAGVALFSSVLVMLGDTFVHGWLFSPGSGLSFMFWSYVALVSKTVVLSSPATVQTPASAPTPGTADDALPAMR